MRRGGLWLVRQGEMRWPDREARPCPSGPRGRAVWRRADGYAEATDSSVNQPDTLRKGPNRCLARDGAPPSSSSENVKENP